MRCFPAIVSARPIKTLEAPGYSAVLLGDIRTAGVNQYAFILVVYAGSMTDPVLIVASELLAGGPQAVLAIFDDQGHQTFCHRVGDWKDQSGFVTEALDIVKRTLGIDLVDTGTF